MKRTHPGWPLPTSFRVLDLRVRKKREGFGLVFEVDITDGRTISTWRFSGVSLVETKPVEVDEDGPTIKTLRGEWRT